MWHIDDIRTCAGTHTDAHALIASAHPPVECFQLVAAGWISAVSSTILTEFMQMEYLWSQVRSSG